MSEDQKPQWQPLSKLPLIASMLDGTLADTEEQYQKLLEARPRPHVLDDYTRRALCAASSTLGTLGGRALDPGSA